MGDMTDNKRKKDYDKHYGKRRKRELTVEEKDRQKEYSRLYRARKKINVNYSYYHLIVARYIFFCSQKTEL
jgi:hypothetical protein